MKALYHLSIIISFLLTSTKVFPNQSSAPKRFPDEEFLPGPDPTWYADSDHDGYGDPNVTFVGDVPPPGYVSNDSDCDDNDPFIHPGVLELCNNLDDDCNGAFDDNIISTSTSVIWEKSFGGIGIDIGQCMAVTTDGGYVVAGSSTSSDGDVTLNHGKTDIWIVRLNSSGTLIWQKSIGGAGDENAQAIQQTNDGGFILCGPTTSNNGDITGNHGATDFAVIKLDSNGNVIWQKSFGGSLDDSPFALDQTRDGGYVIAGTTFSNNGNVTGDHPGGDYWIVKLDHSGALMWQKGYGGSAFDFAHAIVQSRDSGYLVSGYARSGDGNVLLNYGQEDMWILKLDRDGDIVWQKTYGGTGGDGANSLQQTFDNGYVLAGTTHSFNLDVEGNHGVHDYWVVKIDSSGNAQWKECLGGSKTENGNWIVQTIDSGYIVTGLSASNNGDVSGAHGKDDFWIVKLSPKGSIEWQKALGGNKNDESFSTFPLKDGRYIVAGETQSTNGDITSNHGGTDFCVIAIAPPSLHTFYSDADGDGYGNALFSTQACAAPPGYVSDSTDCDDTNPLVHPLAIDFCNDLDDNCNSLIDENSVTATISPLITATICNTSTLTLQAGVFPGYTYQWQKSGVNLNGETNSSYLVTGAGTYSVMVSNGGCSASSPSTIIKTTMPFALVQPNGTMKVCPGTSVTFSVMGMPGIMYQWYNASGMISGATNKNYAAILPDTYHVVESDITGCTFNSTSSTLQNHPAATANITVIGDLNICATGSVKLVASVFSGYTYQWIRSNVPISGATDSVYVAIQPGNYKYKATNTTGCTAFSPIKVVSGCKLENPGAEDGSEINVYPNPVSEGFNISLQLRDTYSGEAVIRMYDALGQIIKSEIVSVANGKLFKRMELLPNTSDGFYTLKVFVGDQIFMNPLVVQKR